MENSHISRLLADGGVRVLGDDNMLDKGDTEELAGVFEASRHLAILQRGSGRAGGVVVGDDDGRGVVFECLGKDVTWMDDARIHRTDRNILAMDELVLPKCHLADLERIAEEKPREDYRGGDAGEGGHGREK